MVSAGFVLPTTVLLLLVLSLTVGALSFRAFSRTTGAIAQREQQVVESAAAPAIERAKSKLEYLFSVDISQNAVPSSDSLITEMLASGDGAPYTLPDEVRLDINGDTVPDNAWSFDADINGDGTLEPGETIVYSITMDDEADVAGTTVSFTDATTDTKAKAGVVRNGPLDVSSASANCPVQLGTNEEGWQELTVGGAEIKKNFQIDAFAVNTNDVNRSVSALEVQQVREARKGNKWAAWFRNDLEIFPAKDFTWNGAMHTEGSFFLDADTSLNLRMLSSQNSCLYSKDASEIELTRKFDADDNLTYEGQVVLGTLDGGFIGERVDLDYEGDGIYSSASGAPNTETLDRTKDSIADESPTTEDIALDPIEVFTADTSTYRKDEGTTWDTDGAFWGKNYAERFDQEDSEPPYLDDTFRADNRFGPKAVYDNDRNLNLSRESRAIGDPIAGSSMEADLIGSTEGLDGYWERQAVDKGLRLIVGQRLQLGNPFGWMGAYASESEPEGPPFRAPNVGADYKSANMDSLYPPFTNTTYDFASDTNQSLDLHRRSLNDKLAAVQSMALYHYKNADKEFPLACMSMVAHPGTLTTELNSRTFNDISATAGTDLDVDFFQGYGTNAWEYGPPLGSESAFKAAYNNSGSSLRKVLKNLAYFAGDPKGGAPSFKPVQDGSTATGASQHPNSYLSMWGDFSHLRLILDSSAALNDNRALGAPSYDSLSPADKTYLHTAACSMGMLADNILTTVGAVGDYSTVQTELDAISTAIGGLNLVGTSALPYSGVSGTATASEARAITPHAVLSKLTASALSDANKQFARIFQNREQIRRDRDLGFLQSQFDYTTEFAHTGANSLVNGKELSAGETIKIGIDPTGPSGTFGIPPEGGTYDPTTQFSTAADELKFLRLQTLAGGTAFNAPSGGSAPTVDDLNKVGLPRYPALYYVFPKVAHDYKGTNSPTNDPIDDQPVGASGELYVDPNIDGSSNTDDYIYTANGGGSAYQYQEITATDLGTIQLQPIAATASWKTPTSTTLTMASGVERPNRILDNGTEKATLFQDRVIMNGRELMSVRTVEMDVDLATTTTYPKTGLDTDKWIPEGTKNIKGGIVYAFREDAQREDGIVRPYDGSLGTRQQAWNTCKADITNASCLMQFELVNPGGTGQAPIDPPLRRTTDAENNFASPKPVDYYADPLRKPYGFMLSNGASLNRPNTAAPNDVAAGLSFITDNAAYIKGDFNLHNGTGGNEQEEFNTSVLGNPKDDEVTFAEFYNNRGTADTDYNTDNFARPDRDNWRPTEIVADAITILSDDFEKEEFVNDAPGVASDYFFLETGGGVGGGESSFQNTQRPNNPGVYANGNGNQFWIPDGNWSYTYDNPFSDNSGTNPPKASPVSPFKIRRNGDMRGAASSGPLPFSDQSDRFKDLQTASETRVNALLISGIVPSRAGQSYGGLHNFPRFLEHWTPNNANQNALYIAGGFFQLNFSTSGTSPFDHDPDSWEPGGTTAAGYRTSYYGAPVRIWGYDVAQQYADPGPIAERFAGRGNLRSEYYQELPAEDPYVKALQCAKYTSGPNDGQFVIDNVAFDQNTDC
ncbi:MAG: hormogonium polysaccharide biosynthesis protein HpsA [Cyanobacteria bacterium P01_D01_bin.44]